MKKLLAFLLVLVMVLSFAACTKAPEQKPAEDPKAEEPKAEEPKAEDPKTEEPKAEEPKPEEPKAEEPKTEEPEPEQPTEDDGIMTYAEYDAAELDTEVVISGSVQAKAYAPAYGNTCLYLADGEGAYYVYRMACTDEDDAALLIGTMIKVTGYKSAWSGEVEISDAAYEVIGEGEVYEALDVTDAFGNDDALIANQNKFVALKGLTVEEIGEGAAFLYKWDGSGVDGDDLYFNVSLNGTVCQFTVESDECGAGTEVYEAVKALQVGDVIDITAFLYWYNGAQPHVCSVAAPTVPTMSYADFLAAEVDTEVSVEGYVQLAAYNATYGNVCLYLADEEGAYYVYRMAATDEDAAVLVPGAKVKVTGYKSAWSGEVEVVDAAYALLEGSYIAPAKDVTEMLADQDALIAYMNQAVSFKGLTVEAIGEGAAFLYKWDGSGADGDDLYFNVSMDGALYQFTVESDEFGAGTDVYEAVKALKVGDVIDADAFLYWYNGAQPHVSAVTVTGSISEKSEGTMTFAEFTAAESDTAVVVEGYVQLAAYNATYGNVCLYLADGEGAYYVYRMTATDDDAAKLVPGAKVKVTGFKSVWSGEEEVADATYELLEGSYIAPAKDVTALLADQDALIAYMNQAVTFKGLTVEAIGDGAAFLYKWDGSGSEGDDLYFNVSFDGTEYQFTVESDEFGSGTEVYEAVKALQVGDVIDVAAFLYWYNGAQPHVCSAVKQ